MASVGLDFTQITPDNGAIREVSRLIFKEVLQSERIGSLLNVFRRVFNGDKVGLIGEFGLLGKEGAGCNPEYGNDAIATEEKTWDIQAWEIAEQLCYKDIEDTLVKYTLNTGTEIGDMTANDYLDEVVVPRLELALMKMYVRIAFFGDKDAESVTDGGVIKDASYVPYFTLIDGIWKQLFTIATADASKRVAISANTQTTKAAQMAGINTEAVNVLNSMINSASPALRQNDNQVIYVTQSFADGLEAQLLASYYGSELHWESIFGGIREARYRGIRLRVVPLWDEIIQSYEGTTTAFNLPHSAIYTTEANLALGVNGTDEFAELDIFFNRDERKNKIYATDKMGALVLDDNMVVVAY